LLGRTDEGVLSLRDHCRLDHCAGTLNLDN